MRKVLFMKKFFLISALLFAALFLAAASADPSVAFIPENPRMGDYVDVTVTPGREGAKSVAWSLSTPEGPVFSGEGADHFSASFRPRLEAVYTLTVTVSYGKNDAETASVQIPVSGSAPVQQGQDVIYSQKDGWWHDKMYSVKHHRSLEKAGCAIFALSHALQHMGVSGEDVLPDRLGETYRSCYVDGRGTANEILLSRAGAVWDFVTEDELIKSEAGLATCFRLGDRFTFSIVKGHIAYADALSEDGTKVHVIDSAPGATYERIKNASVYVRWEDGSFTEAKAPEEIPGIRWFFETGEYGGVEYWLDLSYCAKRGMRLIRPRWMSLDTEDGPVSVTPDYIGAYRSCVKLNGEKVLVRTGDLRWTSVSEDGLKIARVSRRNTVLTDADGKKVPGIKALQTGALATVLCVGDKQLYVYYKGAFGYIPKANTELLDVEQEDGRTALISVNGRTAGTAQVNIRLDPTGKQSQYTWVVGTPVTILDEKGGYFYAEGGGIRGWVKKDYVTPDASGDAE